MPDEIKTVLEEMKKTHASLKEYVDKSIEESRASASSVPHPATVEALEKVNNELTELRKSYDELVKAGNRPNGGAAGALDDDNPEKLKQIELRRSAFVKYIRHGMGEVGRSIMTEDEVRSLSSMSDRDGGFLVPVEWESELLREAFDDAELRPIIGAKPTGRDTVFMPAISKPVVAWGTTNLAVDPQDLTTGGERITIYDLKALTLIHNNTLEDSDANIWAELTDAFSSAIAEAEDDAFGTAAGNNSPQGVLADSRITARYTPTGVADALSDASNNGVDALIGAMYSLKKTYRRNATWGMNSTTESGVRQFKDGEGRYLWQPPIQAGDPPTLLGKPVVNPEGFPDVAANSFPIVIGDFKRGYRIRDRRGIVVQRLIERYAEYSQTGFMVTRRVGGQPVLPEAFQTVKVATT